MADIIIGKAKVIAIEEVTLVENPKVTQANHIYGAGMGALNNYMSEASFSAPTNTETAPSKPKTVIISRLKVESAGKVEGFSVIEGIMQLPMQLPFGKVFELTLHDPGTGVLDTNDRMFKDEANA